MTNHVGNSIFVNGPDTEIDRLLVTCFHVLIPDEECDDEGLQFNFDAVIPVAATGTELTDAECRKAWGTKWNAYDTMILRRSSGLLAFEFNTANNFPEPVYRRLGRMFPRLEFDIAAIDPGEWWAMTGHIAGGNAAFDENADCRMVYERVYKEPFETVLQADT